MTNISGKQLHRMVDEAILKEQVMWKPLELNGNATRNGSSPVTYEHRAEIIPWLSLVSVKFQFYPEAPALAVALLDKFLSCVKVQLKYLKCVALTCLHIASKMTEEDEVVPHVADLVSLTSANCSTDDIVRMERLILTKLDWNVNLATSLHFLQVCHSYLLSENTDLLASVPQMTGSRQLAFLTHKLQLCMSSAEACQWSPSMIAVSLLSLELEQFRSDWFPLTLSLLKFIQRVNFSELIGCKERLSFHMMMTLQLAQHGLQSDGCRQHKRSRHHTNSNSKRKMVGPSPLDQDDIYASIKGLYGEDGNEEIPGSATVIAKIGNED